jgi:phage tail sheath gpL-like
LYIGGSYVPVNVGPSDTVDEIAQAIADQINTTYTDLGTEALPVTAHAAPTGGICTLTATWKGINGNDIQIMLNYYGPRGSQYTPDGLGITLPPGFYTVDNAGVAAGGTGYTVGDTIQLGNGAAVEVLGVDGSGGINVVEVSSEGNIPGGPSAVIPPNPVAQVTTSGSGTGATFNLEWQLLNAGFLTGGVGTPVMDAAITAIQKQAFEYVALPYTDSQSLFDWDQEYGFTDQGRWGWQRQQFGHVFCAKRGTYADLVLYGEMLNSGVESIMAFENDTPSPMFECCAAYTAKAQRALINDPARPLQTLSLNKILSVQIPERFNFVEINSLASNGLAIQEVGSDGQPMILREQTTYQLNLYGQSDDAYELVTTLATLAKLLRNQRQAITSKYPRHKLADDGTKFGPGQAIVTPGIIKAELVNEYQMDMWNGLVENLAMFKQTLLVERDPNDPNRLNVLYPPDLINQLRIFAVLAQFRLQYDRGIDYEIIGTAPAPYQASSNASLYQ